MKCQVCGRESGKYPLCRMCNEKRRTGEVIKCSACGRWHYAGTPCPEPEPFLYRLKAFLVTRTEKDYWDCIVSELPEGYAVFPQVNLAAFIERTDDARYHSELFRNVDFLVTDTGFRPKLVIEINDKTHLAPERQERDRKVAQICEEAGIPVFRLWTSYGVNPEYIHKRLQEILSAPSPQRVAHFGAKKQLPKEESPESPRQEFSTHHKPGAYAAPKKKACYIATCVYGTYDCPQVWILRRFRDEVLCRRPLGRLFVRAYYAVSPRLVKMWGDCRPFRSFWRWILDLFTGCLKEKGIPDSFYQDEAGDGGRL